MSSSYFCVLLHLIAEMGSVRFKFSKIRTDSISDSKDIIKNMFKTNKQDKEIIFVDS